MIMTLQDNHGNFNNKITKFNHFSETEVVVVVKRVADI